MADYTLNKNLYKWKTTDTKRTTITEMAKNAEKIDDYLTQMDVEVGSVKTDLASIAQVSIKSFGAKGDGVTDDTQALIKAGKSAKTVFFPPGTYLINQTIVLAQFTKFVSNGGANLKIQADVDVFWITSDNKISNFTIDLYSLTTYTSNIFEISSKSINTMTTKNNASYYTCIIEKIHTIFSNANTSGANGTIFHIWAKPKDENGNAYPWFASGFFNIRIKEIYTIGAVAYFMRNYVWNENYYVNHSDRVAWVTGVSLDDVSIFGSVIYGIFDAPDEASMTDEHYHGVSPMWITKVRYQYGARTKKFAFLSDGLRNFKDCIPWDWPDSSVSLLYRTQATYIINNRPYVFMDAGFGTKHYFFDVVSSTTLTTKQKNDWIDSRLVGYRDSTVKMPLEERINLVQVETGASDISPLIQLAKYTPTGSRATGIMILSTGYLGTNAGLVLVSLNVTDNDISDPLTNPSLNIVTTPDRNEANLGIFGVKKEVVNGVTTHTIYFNPKIILGPSGASIVPISVFNGYQMPINPISISTNSTITAQGARVGYYRTSNMVSSAAPTTGYHLQGEIVYNSAPAASGYIGWVCVASGEPGTWKGFGAIQA